MSDQNSVQIEPKPLAEIAKEWEGQVVNAKYRLREYIGGSERSAVFLTYSGGQSQEPAAIKFIPDDSGDADLQMARWQSAASLSHPHLLRIFEFGRCQLAGAPFFFLVMEYAEEDLAQILPHRALKPDEMRAMLAPALDALEYLHGQGLVHGRIKPSNVMASGDQLKFSADGVCRIGDPVPASAINAAPEAETSGLSPATDVWALGFVLVEALTQHASAWNRTGRDEPDVPATLPPPFFDIARNCLRIDSRRRWTISEIALGLRGPQPRPVARPAAIEPQPRIATGKPRYLLPGFALALVLVTIVVGSKLLDHKTEQPAEKSVAPAAAVVAVARHDAANAKKSSTSKLPTPTKTISGRSNAPASGASVSAPGKSENKGIGSLPQATSALGDVIHQVLPDVPEKAKATIRGTVRVGVRVRVDASGNVTEAKLDSPGPSQYFAALALQAAHQWQFRTAKSNGQAARGSDYILRFEFTGTDTRAFAAQAQTNTAGTH